MPEFLPYIRAVYEYLLHRLNNERGSIVSVRSIDILKYAGMRDRPVDRMIMRYILSQLARAYGGEVIVRNDTYIYRLSVPTLRRIINRGFNAFASLIRVIDEAQAKPGRG